MKQLKPKNSGNGISSGKDLSSRDNFDAFTLSLKKVKEI